MSDIELRLLAALRAVAEEGSFGRAGARLNCTQSTISQQIAALEKAVGGPVFDRPGGPKPVRITPLGMVVLAHARELLAKATAMADAIDRFQAGEGRVDIGTFQSVSTVILPRVVRRLLDRHPGCDIRLSEDEMDPPRIHDLDLTFFDGRVNGEVEHRKLLDDPYLLVARCGAFPEGPVRLDCLDGAPLVAYPPVCDQARLERMLAQAGVRPRIVFRTVGNEAVLAMVRAGLGSAVLPRLVVRGAVGSADVLCVHEFRAVLPPREIFLLWRAGRAHSPLAKHAIEIAVAEASELADRG